jgi:hypothetical protein
MVNGASYELYGELSGRYKFTESRDSSVGIALGYGLAGRGSRVRFPAGAGNFSVPHRVQNDSGDQGLIPWG